MAVMASDSRFGRTNDSADTGDQKVSAMLDRFGPKC